MNWTVFPGGPLRGEWAAPGDKSLSHRAALFAALAEGESRIDHFLISGVTEVMLRALSSLGVEWQLDGDSLRVRGRGLAGLTAPAAALQCGGSATTLRLLAGALAAAGIPAVLDGSEGLRRRPMERIAAPLREMGATVDTATGGGAPLRLDGRPPGRFLRGGTFQLEVASAQVKTCLLLAGLGAGEPVEVVEPALSRDHTERMLAGMGARVESRVEAGGPAHARLLPLERPLHPLRGRLPGDLSAAAFLIAAALITPGSEITVREVGLNPTRTGLLDVLAEMGASIEVLNRRESFGEPIGDLRVRASVLRGVTVGGGTVVRMIDEFPAFAAAAAFAGGPSRVLDAQELRYKESDRITALCTELRRLGVDALETPDGFELPGGGVRGGDIQPHGDHRLAMSLALTGLAAREPVTVRGAEIVRESFPNFGDVLRGLGARIEETA